MYAIDTHPTGGGLLPRGHVNRLPLKKVGQKNPPPLSVSRPLSPTLSADTLFQAPSVPFSCS